eukprot:6176179-Alexandrium_andersonii.AAC.1
MASVAALVRDAISQRTGFSPRRVHRAMGVAGWEEVSVGSFRAACGAAEFRRVYKHCGERTIFAR